MAKKPDWDYALKIKGVTLKSLPISQLADYLKEFAGLLGEGARPVLDGIVKGSVIVRIKQAGEHPAYTRNRMQVAANDPSMPAARNIQRIETLMKRDGAYGEIVDRNENVIVDFKHTKEPIVLDEELVIHDVGALDGRVISIVGADDTVHVRLQDVGGIEHKITLRDLGMAKQLAVHFRGGPVRVQVHGTWKRTAGGKWEPHQVYADHVEVLDDASAKDVFLSLREVPTGWTTIADPIKEWEDIRGINDLHA